MTMMTLPGSSLHTEPLRVRVRGLWPLPCLANCVNHAGTKGVDKEAVYGACGNNPVY